MASTLGYWTVRALGEQCRMLLQYCGEEYKETEYNFGPGFSKDEWYNARDALGLDFPNLPYYIDGDIKITQSEAILRYLARKYKLCGDTEQEKVAIDMMSGTSMDFLLALFRATVIGSAEDKAKYASDVIPVLTRFSKFLGVKKWFCGDKITFPDFQMYQLLNAHQERMPGCLDDFKSLTDFMGRFEALPAIQSYIATEKYKNRPMFPTI